ncbi:hypothetical protein Vretifemale_4816 [Volvox reticuliferus]|uniref:PPM-type phosphatase domain-containing protein n=2 Tax=Volvox reticuliferus TaxID=1737510 RepID=A0A8J4C3Q4_9CHLO|nr:hypothetical protein Vretifemale_4816 [Volvox reticuliferus]
MSEGSDIRHEVVREDVTSIPSLHVYLPEGLAPSDVEVMTENSSDALQVFIEHVATERVLSTIKLPGYAPHEDSLVKYSKKHRRFTMSLQIVPAAPSTAESPALSDAAAAAVGMPREPTASPGRPSIPAASHVDHSSASSGSPASAAAPSSLRPAGTCNSFGLLDKDDISDGEGEGNAGVGKKKKKKKKGKKAGASGEGQGEADTAGAPAANGNHAEGEPASRAAGGGSSGDDAESKPTAGEEGAAGAAKKKKKKRKKAAAAATAAGAEGDVVVGDAKAEVDGNEGALPNHSSPPQPQPPTLADLPSVPNSVPASGAPSAPASAPISKHASRAMFVDLVEDFGDEKLGTFELGAALHHDPLVGPAVHSGLGKVQVKGEDKWLEAPTNSWCFKGLDGACTPVSAFGIFDGHGGRMAAQHAAKQLLPLVAGFAERAVSPDAPISAEQLAAEGYLAAEESSIIAGSAEDEAALGRARVMAAQDALIARLPKALHAGFVQCDEDVISRHKTSGTTATMAVQVGWELLVANVGDSLAYLDTGSEIVVVSANHRVAESTEEQERILNAGGRIKPAKYDEDDLEGEVPASATPHEGQQLRVWPGGINMTRTIGDEAAKGLLIAEPSVRQISLPVTGARLIIASDGLWDAVNAKTIIGQLRTCTAREAASKAAVYAMRNKKHDDDVTVVVADFVPRQTDLHVPGLLKRAPGPSSAALAALAAAGMKEERAVQSWRPLESHAESWRSRHRVHRQRAAAYLHQLELAEKAEVEAKEELERQRRMAVAPAAGTAGVGTAVRSAPESATYRELVGLKVPLEALKDMNDEPAAGEIDDDGTQVDAKKKKETGFDFRKELVKAARPGEGKPARSPGGTIAGGDGGGGGRGSGEERLEASGRRGRRGRGGGADRERRPPRRERDGGSGAADTAPVQPAEGTAAQADQQHQQVDQQRQQFSRGERWERADRRERGGRNGRGGRNAGGSAVPAGADEPSNASTAATAAAAHSVPSGIVKADGYLYVPKSLLNAGAHVPPVVGAAGPGPGPATIVPTTGPEGAGDAKPRRERGVRSRNRRDSAASPSAAVVQDGTEKDQSTTEPSAASAHAAPASNTSRRNVQGRRQMEREAAAAAAAAAATAAVGGLLTSSSAAARPAAPLAPAPVGTHTPAGTSNDPVVVLESSSGHRQRRQQHLYSASQQTAYTASQATQAPQEPTAAASRRKRTAQHGPSGHAAVAGPTAGNAMRLADSHSTMVQPQAPPPPQPRATYQQQPQQAQQQQQPQRAPTAAAPPAVPTYAGPLDFGAGFGPASGMWPPSGASSQYGGGFSANGETAVPQRPPGLSGAPTQRSQSEIAAAAAAAAAAAVARKAAAARGSGGGAAGQHAHGRT